MNVFKFFISDKLEEYVSTALFLALILLCTMQILFRFVFNFSLSWTEELARYVFIALVYFSASLAIHKDAHVRVEVIDGFVSGKSKKVLDSVIDFSFAAFVAWVGFYGLEISIDAIKIEQTSPALNWQIGWVYAIVPLAFYLMAIRLLQRIYLRLSGKLDTEGTINGASAPDQENNQGGAS